MLLERTSEQSLERKNYFDETSMTTMFVIFVTVNTRHNK